jgi:single-strand DNA-binding protein
MKQITIAGNIGKDAETRTTQGGDKVTSWSVAVEERTGKDKSTIWFDCSLWGKRGESLASYLTKGSKVAVSGDLGKREHEGKTYLTIRADQVTLLGGKPSQDDGGYSAQPKQQTTEWGTNVAPTYVEDEIPF